MISMFKQQSANPLGKKAKLESKAVRICLFRVIALEIGQMHFGMCWSFINLQTEQGTEYIIPYKIFLTSVLCYTG